MPNLSRAFQLFYDEPTCREGNACSHVLKNSTHLVFLIFWTHLDRTITNKVPGKRSDLFLLKCNKSHEPERNSIRQKQCNLNWWALARIVCGLEQLIHAFKAGSSVGFDSCWKFTTHLHPPPPPCPHHAFFTCLDFLKSLWDFYSP